MGIKFETEYAENRRPLSLNRAPTQPALIRNALRTVGFRCGRCAAGDGGFQSEQALKHFGRCMFARVCPQVASGPQSSTGWRRYVSLYTVIQ